MLIKIAPNFIIPGFEGKNHLEFDQERVILLNVLEKLSAISKGRIKFLRPEQYVSEYDFWIKINDEYVDGVKGDLERELHDGDTVSIFLATLGGG